VDNSPEALFSAAGLIVPDSIARVCIAGKAASIPSRRACTDFPYVAQCSQYQRCVSNHAPVALSSTQYARSRRWTAALAHGGVGVDVDCARTLRCGERAQAEATEVARV